MSPRYKCIMRSLSFYYSSFILELRGANKKNLHSKRTCPLRGGGVEPWRKNLNCLACYAMRENAKKFPDILVRYSANILLLICPSRGGD